MHAHCHMAFTVDATPIKSLHFHSQALSPLSTLLFQDLEVFGPVSASTPRHSNRASAFT